MARAFSVGKTKQMFFVARKVFSTHKVFQQEHTHLKFITCTKTNHDYSWCAKSNHDPITILLWARPMIIFRNEALSTHEALFWLNGFRLNGRNFVGRNLANSNPRTRKHTTQENLGVEFNTALSSASTSHGGTHTRMHAYSLAHAHTHEESQPLCHLLLR